MIDVSKAALQKEEDLLDDEDMTEFDSFEAPDENEEDALKRLTLETDSLIEMLIEDEDARIRYSDEIEQLSETIMEAKEILGIKY